MQYQLVWKIPHLQCTPLFVYELCMFAICLYTINSPIYIQFYFNGQHITICTVRVAVTEETLHCSSCHPRSPTTGHTSTGGTVSTGAGGCFPSSRSHTVTSPLSYACSPHPILQTNIQINHLSMERIYSAVNKMETFVLQPGSHAIFARYRIFVNNGPLQKIFKKRRIED